MSFKLIASVYLIMYCTVTFNLRVHLGKFFERI